jgi:hypothetical protein
VQGSNGYLGGNAGGAGGEDCLRVNIYATFEAVKDNKLFVRILVYIHCGVAILPRISAFDLN